ncbi:MAG TPA: siderophore-interacting protein [Solirubrobacteraceae bacterium]|nr:siderophore-interacting protein [Solirubrobacteraceae bacterium]
MSTTAAKSARPERRRTPRVVEVLDVTQLTPRMVRIDFGGEGLEGFAAGEFTDHYVKIQFPPPGADYAVPFDQEEIRATRPREQWPRTRTYSVRAWDPDRLRLTVDFVVHGDEGIAGPWAQQAAPGDRLQLQGPGGAYAPDPDAPAYLMVGDPSVMPAIAAALERIPSGRRVDVVLQIADTDDQIELTTRGDLRLRWLHAPGDEVLVEAIRELELPEQTDAFVHGEASSVRALRRHLIVERGIPRDALSVSGYWKRARTEEGWREDKPEWNRLVQADEDQAA